MPSSRSQRLADSTSFMLIGLGRLLQRRFEQELAEEGITLRHLGALGHLRGQSGLSVSDLAKRAGVTAQSMHATIGQLVERGAIDAGKTRQGRASKLEVTREGERLLRFAARVARRLDGDLQKSGTDLTPLRQLAIRSFAELRFKPK